MNLSSSKQNFNHTTPTHDASDDFTALTLTVAGETDSVWSLERAPSETMPPEAVQRNALQLDPTLLEPVTMVPSAEMPRP